MVIVIYLCVFACVCVCVCVCVLSEESEGRPPIKVKFEIPYFTTSGIQVKSPNVLCCVASVQDRDVMGGFSTVKAFICCVILYHTGSSLVV